MTDREEIYKLSTVKENARKGRCEMYKLVRRKQNINDAYEIGILLVLYFFGRNLKSGR